VAIVFDITPVSNEFELRSCYLRIYQKCFLILQEEVVKISVNFSIPSTFLGCCSQHVSGSVHS
jgi:hypothetical protein